MTDTPTPGRPGNEPGDERLQPPDAPTEPVGATEPAETTSLRADGLPASGQPYPGPPEGDWTPVAPRGGRLRRAGRRVRGSRVALAIVAVVVAAGLALGGFALAGGGHDGRKDKAERDGRGAVSQRDGDNNRGNRGNDGNDSANGNGNGSGEGNGRGGRDRGGRGNNNAQDGNGTGNGNGNGTAQGGNGTTGTRQEVLGVVTRITSSSITVRTAGGSPSYALTAATPVTRGGSAASVADVKVGDAVVLHLVIASAGTAPVVERIAG